MSTVGRMQGSLREGTDAELLTRARASLSPGRQGEWSTEPDRERLPGRSCGCRAEGDLTWRRLETPLPLDSLGLLQPCSWINAADTCDTSKATLPPSTEQDRGWV